METTTSGTQSGNGAGAAPGSRSADQIRSDIVRQRQELAGSVDALRGRVSQITDVKGQLRAHQGQLIAGAAIVGLAVGAALWLRYRR